MKSFIRVVDRTTFNASGYKLPKAMPPVTFRGKVVMGWTGGEGNHVAKVRLVPPTLKVQDFPEMPFFLDSEERGQDMVIDMTALIQEAGLYWIEFWLDETLRLRVPWRVIYNPTNLPPPPPVSMN